ncbi:MAG: hypothetical protein ACI93T_002387, partial [Porticoccaceae bacterium]
FAEVTRVGGERSNVFRDAGRIKIVDRLIGHRHCLSNIVRLISGTRRRFLGQDS